MFIPDDKTIFIGRVNDKRNGTGSTIYNTLYREMGLNAVYLQFESNDSESFAKGLRALGIKGCTVVGTHSKAIIPYLDDLDSHAEAVGSVNTVVNDNGKLCGYKTDGPALIAAIKEKTTLKRKKIVMLGAGKLGKEVLLRLKHENPSEVIIFNRTIEKGEALGKEFDVRFGGSIDAMYDESGDIFINATHVGAAFCDTKDIFPEDFLQNFDLIMDVTFIPFSTPLQDKASKLGKIVIPGWRMFAYQGMRQVELYTGQVPSIERLCELIKEEFS